MSARLYLTPPIGRARDRCRDHAFRPMRRHEPRSGPQSTQQARDAAPGISARSTHAVRSASRYPSHRSLAVRSPWSPARRRVSAGGERWTESNSPAPPLPTRGIHHPVTDEIGQHRIVRVLQLGIRRRW